MEVGGEKVGPVASVWAEHQVEVEIDPEEGPKLLKPETQTDSFSLLRGLMGHLVDQMMCSGFHFALQETGHGQTTAARRRLRRSKDGLGCLGFCARQLEALEVLHGNREGNCGENVGVECFGRQFTSQRRGTRLAWS